MTTVGALGYPQEKVTIWCVMAGSAPERPAAYARGATGVVLRAKVHRNGRAGDAEAIDLVRGAFSWRSGAVPRPKLVLGRVASR